MAFQFLLVAMIGCGFASARAQSEPPPVIEPEALVEDAVAPRTEASVDAAPATVPVVEQAAPETASPAEGEITKKAEIPPAERKSARRGFVVGYEYGYNYYNEPKVMSEMGHLHGLNASFEVRPDGSFLLLRLSGELLFGGMVYDGALYNKETNTSKPWTSSSNDSLYAIKGVIGFPVMTWNGGDLGPIAGIGTRYLNDQLEGQGAYEREISYLYLPVGLEARFFLPSDRTLTLTAEYDHFLGGSVKSHLSEVGYSRDVNNTQTDGRGYRVVADLASRLGERMDLHIAPYYQKWDIEDSDEVLMDRTHWHEPKNSTEQFGVVLAVGL